MDVLIGHIFKVDGEDIEFIDKEHKLKDILNNNKNNKNLPKNILHFFYNLCLCNDVEIDYKKLEKNSIIEYISSSSDEKSVMILRSVLRIMHIIHHIDDLSTILL